MSKRIGKDVRISRRAVVYSSESIEIGNHVWIDDFAFLSGGKESLIGGYVHIATYSALYGKFGTKIRDYVNISSRVGIYSTSNDYSGKFMMGSMVEQSSIHDICRNMQIGSYVIIGTGSVLLPGAVAHERVAVGAMSFVKDEIQEFKIYCRSTC